MFDSKKIRQAYSSPMAKANSPGGNVKLLNFTAAAVNRSDRVAILVGEGVNGAGVKTIYHQLVAYGALPCLVDCNSERPVITEYIDLNVDQCVSTSRATVYEAIVIPDGDAFAKNCQSNISTLNFVRQEYNHCKPILAIGAACLVLERSNISSVLPSGLADPSIIIGTSAQLKKALAELNAMLPQCAFPLLGTTHK